MSNMEKVQEYVSALSEPTQELANKAIKDMRAEGFKWTWLLAALEIKEPEEWEKWGFGLLFNKAFRAQVEKKLANKKSLPIWIADTEPTTDNYTLSFSMPTTHATSSRTILDEAVTELIGSLGLDWEDVMSVVQEHLDITPAVKQALDTIPDEAISKSIEIEKDCSDAPKWFNKYSGKWEMFDPKEFTDEITTRNPAVSMDVRNVDAIRYALENNIVPASNLAYFQRLLEAAERLA